MQDRREQDRREKGGRGEGRGEGRQPTHHFLMQKVFFHVKSDNIKSLHVINIWDFGLFTEQDVSDKK